MSVLDKNISFFPSTRNTTNGMVVNLMQLLKSNEHEAAIKVLRAGQDPQAQKLLKEKLPCYTVSGVFNRRCEDGLILPSGLAAIDLDCAEDYNPVQLLHELAKLKFIAYAGLSCRGERLFAIVPFLNPEKYSLHYVRLIQSFEDIGLPMGDTCHKAISQPRYVSYNTSETCFYNHSAAPYHLLPVEHSYHHIKLRDQSTINLTTDPFRWCETQVQKTYAFTDGTRHKYIIALARYCNIKGISESTTLSQCLSNYVLDDFNEHEITRIVKHVYTKHVKSHNELPFIDSPKLKNKQEAKLSPDCQSNLPNVGQDHIVRAGLNIGQNNEDYAITDETKNEVSGTFYNGRLCSIGAGKIVSGILSKSGRFYVHIPNGRTEVFLNPEAFVGGSNPIEVLCFSDWMELKSREYDNI